MRYRPRTIKAEQWFKNGDHSADYTTDAHDFDGTVIPAEQRKERGWEGEVVRYFRSPEVLGQTVHEVCSQTWHVHGWIDSGPKGHTVCPGDWILGADGTYVPCKPDLFLVIFEPEPVTLLDSGIARW